MNNDCMKSTGWQLYKEKRSLVIHKSGFTVYIDCYHVGWQFEVWVDGEYGIMIKKCIGGLTRSSCKHKALKWLSRQTWTYKRTWPSKYKGK